MKKYTFILIAIGLLALPAFTFAQAPKQTTTPAAQAAKVQTEPLTVRKQKVEAQLLSIFEQLSTIHTRTQLAVDRLTQNDIDTVRAQTQLTNANIFLNEAKLNIDAFSKIAVTDDKAFPAEKTVALKEAVRKSEESLKLVRDSLISSLAHLKATLIISTTTETVY